MLGISSIVGSATFILPGVIATTTGSLAPFSIIIMGVCSIFSGFSYA